MFLILIFMNQIGKMMQIIQIIQIIKFIQKIQTSLKLKYMRKSNIQKISSDKPQKQTSTSSNQINPIKFSYHNYANLTNQQYLFHSLKLLGISQTEYLKQTKLSMTDQIFGKNQSATNTKQFYFIVFKCLKFLCNQQELGLIKIWYPPRTVNEQLEFKKTLYTLFNKLESKNKIPKKFLISKTFLMAETSQNKIIQFLRILAELALRSDYLNRFSKNQRLIDIQFSDTQNPQTEPNDINRVYVFPFVPQNQTSIVPPLQVQEIQALKNVYKTHIEIYRKKILSLGSQYPKQQQISCQQLMSQIVQQKQIAEKLTKKIPKSFFSQNRSFDRRQLIDKSRYIWSFLNKIECHFIQKNDIPILKLQGQVDKILSRWETATGINKMIDVNQKFEKVNILKEKCKQRIQEFRNFNYKVKIALSNNKI